MTGKLEALGARLVVISPQLPEHGQSMIERHKLSYDLLQDPGNEFAAQLGLRFELPGYLKDIYKSFGLDLEAANGEDSWTLPMPARFVVDGTGVIRSVDVDPDYTVRPKPQATVEVVAAL